MITGENNHTWELGENGMVCTPDNGGSGQIQIKCQAKHRGWRLL